MAHTPYRTREQSVKLADVVARLNGNVTVPAPYNMPYSTSDVTRAKSILDRLIAQVADSEVSYITDVVIEVDEIEEA